MKQTQKLQKIIEKAIENGWDMFGWPKFQVVMGGIGLYEGSGDFIDGRGERYDDDAIIFSHDFLNAYFGEDELCIYCGSDEFSEFDMRGLPYDFDYYECVNCGETNVLKAWQYYGGKLVLQPEDKRIDYLYKHI